MSSFLVGFSFNSGHQEAPIYYLTIATTSLLSLAYLLNSPKIPNPDKYISNAVSYMPSVLGTSSPF